VPRQILASGLRIYQIAGAEMLAGLKKRIQSEILGRYPVLDLLVQEGKVRWETRICNRGEMETYVRLYPDS
jgi:hypothetical protein